MKQMHCIAATFYSASFSKPIPVWFGTKKNDFANHRFQTQFRLVWDNSDYHCQCPENSKPNSVLFGKIIDY